MMHPYAVLVVPVMEAYATVKFAVDSDRSMRALAAALAHPKIPEATDVLGGRHDGHAGQRRPGDHVLEALPPVAPRLAHDVLSVDVEQVEAHEGHRPPGLATLREDAPDPCVPVAGHGLAVKDGGVQPPGELAEEGEARVPEQLMARPRVDVHRAPAGDVHVGALSIQRGLRHIRSPAEARQVAERRAEHRREERHHTQFIKPTSA